MRYLSVCSGIEAATVAWHPLGWKAVAYSEVEPFPCSLLKHHYPETPNWGDMTKWKDWPDETVDLLAGGTPCQAFSVAGQRGGMDDPRGQLALGFCGIAAKYRPRWIVWENVPGVLSSGQGRDFGSFVQSLVDCGYGCAWRVLDAQHFGVAQRRRRVFVVGHLGDWRRAAAVLFERESLCRDSAKGGKAREGVAERSVVGAITRSWSKGLGHNSQDDMAVAVMAGSGKEDRHTTDGTCPTLKARMETGGGNVPLLANAFTAADARRTGTIKLHEQAPTLTSQTKRGDTEPCVLAFEPGVMSRDGGHVYKEVSGTIRSQPGDNRMAVAIGTDCYNGAVTGDISMTLKAGEGNPAVNQPTVVHAMQVRRLTPIECERLQGFPDNYTNVPHRGKPAADGPRYKALGNSMAVPCMAWIGNRIQMVEGLK